MIGRFRQYRTLGHTGAVYGFTSSFTVLPEAKLAAIVLANEDLVPGPTKRLSEAALSLLLEAKLGEVPPAVRHPGNVDPAPLAGDYESPSFWARLEAVGGRLIGHISGQFTRFEYLGDLSFTAHSRIEEGLPVLFEQDPLGHVTGFQFGPQHFTRVSASRRLRLPREWRDYRGSYGPGFIPVILSERLGHLYAMTENMVDYRLTPVNRHVCALPAGLYADEHVVFLTGRGRRPHGIAFAGMTLARRREANR
jgi:serine beta-lactamase-like protein LACTB